MRTLLTAAGVLAGVVLLAVGTPGVWQDSITPADPLAPLDRFEENVSLAFAGERVNLSAPGPEREGAMADFRALLASLRAERDAEAVTLEKRYGSGLLTPAQFNDALAALREGRQRLADLNASIALAHPPLERLPA